MFSESLKLTLAVAKNEVSTTVLKTTVANSASSAPKSSFFDSFSLQSLNSVQNLELFFRVLRIASAVFAIFFIFLLLQGALQYMVSSGSDDKVRHCRYLIFVGGAGMAVMLCIYIIATSGLVRLGTGS